MNDLFAGKDYLIGKMINRKREIKLLLISISVLFIEVLLIRWISSELRAFSFFHNAVLIICFIGTGIGCAICDKRIRLINSFVLILALISWVNCPFPLGVLSAKRLSELLSVFSGNTFFFQVVPRNLEERILFYLLGIIIFSVISVMITYIFIPLGQIMGRLFNEHDNTIRAYSINIFGSLLGVWLFFFLSYFWTTPALWFLLALLPLCYFMIDDKKELMVSILIIVCSLMLLIFDYYSHSKESLLIWSPYNKLILKSCWITTREHGPVRWGYHLFQEGAEVPFCNACNLSAEFKNKYPELFAKFSKKPDCYNLPYALQNKKYNHVLILGSGLGNDIAAALRNGAMQVDAVEIDPAIIYMGKQFHPENAYTDPRVRVINNDARNFYRNCKKTYDLIVFGFVDSVNLSSSYANIRLDNYIYTLESFQEARKLLAPDGLMILTRGGAEPFIYLRPNKQFQEVFGYLPFIRPVRVPFDYSDADYGISYIAAGNEDILKKMGLNIKLTVPPEMKDLRVSTDDWPYFYLKDNKIPTLYYVAFFLITLVAFIVTRVSFGKNPFALNWHFFFLGAGFLLLEVQNVSKMALLLGVTWVANTAIISAVMLMILLSNLYVRKIRITSPVPYYLGLIISIFLNFIIPVNLMAGLSPYLHYTLVSLFYSLPIFFAGIVFIVSFSGSENKAHVLGSNLLGATVGGFLESFSYVWGLKALLLIAALLYGASYMALKKK